MYEQLGLDSVHGGDGRLDCDIRPRKRCFFVPSTMLGDDGRAQIHLRLQEAANNQRRGILWAKDFTEW